MANSKTYPNLLKVIENIEEDARSTNNPDNTGETTYYQGDKLASPQITAILEAIKKDESQS